MTRCDPLTFDGPLTVDRLVDDLVEARGWPVDSLKVEQFWLPILGPSAVVVLRRLDRDLQAAEGPIIYELGTFGAEVGLPGRGKAKIGSSPLARTLARLVDFRACQLVGERLLVRSHLAPLTARQFDRLTDRLRAAYPSEVA